MEPRGLLEPENMSINCMEVQRGFVWPGEANLSSCQVDRGLQPPWAPSWTNVQHAEHDAGAKQTAGKRSWLLYNRIILVCRFETELKPQSSNLIYRFLYCQSAVKLKND